MPTKSISWEANDLDWADGYLKLTRLIIVPAIHAHRLGQHTAELMMKISLAGGAAAWLESKGIAPQPAGLVQLEPFFGKVANFCMYYANGSVSEKLAFAFIDDGAFDTAYCSLDMAKWKPVRAKIYRRLREVYIGHNIKCLTVYNYSNLTKHRRTRTP